MKPFNHPGLSMSRHLPRRTVLRLGAAASASVVLTGSPAFAAPPGAGRAPAPTGLLTDLLTRGLGTTAGQRPRFSWQVPDLGPGTRQRAYQLEVAATPAGFKDRQLVWDSGKVAAAGSTAVAYDGPALEPRTAYWWRVSSWGAKRSSWSEPVLMATAVEDQWQAEPIWVPAGPTLTDGTFTTRLKITSVAAGLWFRATDTANNYMWQLRADDTAGVLRKHVCVDGTYSVIGEVTLPTPITTGEWVDLSVTMSGSTFTTGVNGTVVDTTTHTRHTSGNIGLRNGRTESQVYDSLRFTTPDGTVLLQDDFSSDKGTLSAGTVADGVLTFPARRLLALLLRHRRHLGAAAARVPAGVRQDGRRRRAARRRHLPRPGPPVRGQGVEQRQPGRLRLRALRLRSRLPVLRHHRHAARRPGQRPGRAVPHHHGAEVPRPAGDHLQRRQPGHHRLG